jgi:hypothetical protein
MATPSTKRCQPPNSGEPVDLFHRFRQPHPTRPTTPQPPPPQFGLKSLLAVVAVLSIVLAVANQVGFYAAAVLLMVVLLVVAHVAGNAIGTSRRDSSPSQESGEPPATTMPGAPGFSMPLIQPTELRESVPLGRRVAVAMLLGAILGGALMAGATFPNWPKLGLAGVAIVALSGGVLGAYAGFMASRFTAAFGRAWRQARIHSQR